MSPELLESNMNLGRELDALIADKVMGLEIVRSLTGSRPPREIITIGQPEYYDIAGCMELQNYVLPYSADITYAWQVVEQLFKRGWDVEIQGYKDPDGLLAWRVNVRSISQQELGQIALSRDVSFAICLAALRALGHEPE